MAEQFAAPPINPAISIQPLNTSAPSRDSSGVPAQLANLAPGTTVEGFVINRDGQGNPILRTPLGDIQIKSDIFIKTGSVVLFKVDPNVPSHARILTIDDLSPQDYVAKQTPNMRQDTITSSSQNMAGTQAAAGKTAAPPLQALLLNTTPPTPGAVAANPLLASLVSGSVPLPAGLAKLQQGATLKITLLQAQLPENFPMASARVISPNFAPTPATGQSAAPASSQSAQPAQASFTPNVAQAQNAPQASTTGALLNAKTAQIAAGTAPATPTVPHTVTNIPTPLAPTSAPPATPTGAYVVAANTSPIVLPTQTVVAANPTTPAPQATPTPLPTASVATTATPASNQTAPVAIQPMVMETALPDEFAVINQKLETTGQIIQAKMAIATLLQTPDEAEQKPVAAQTAQTNTEKTPAPSQQQTQQAAAPLPKGSVPVVVIGHERDGAIILQASFGTLKSYMPQPFPVGTKLAVTLEPESRPAAPPPVSTPLTGDMEQMTSRARDWSSLDDVLRWALANDPALAREITQHLPSIGPKLTSSIMFFLAAVKGGDVRQWIGARALQALELKAPALAIRLKQDMLQLQGFMVESPLQNWTNVMIPLFHGGELEQARLFFRHDQEDDGKSGKGGGGQRFIVEVDLSQLGDLQFDGFVRDGKRGKQFDLIVRSATDLPGPLLNEIRTIFENSMQITGYKGYLAFQHGTEHFVRPLAETSTGSADSGNTILA